MYDVLKPKRLQWELVDNTTSPYFDVWECNLGYKQCFKKGEDPNWTRPYGQHSANYGESPSVDYSEIEKWSETQMEKEKENHYGKESN